MLPKLRKDFGVRALFGTLIILGVMLVCLIGLGTGNLNFREFLPLGGVWVGTVIGFYFGKKN